jgi:hypothetical protein
MDEFSPYCWDKCDLSLEEEFEESEFWENLKWTIGQFIRNLDVAILLIYIGKFGTVFKPKVFKLPSSVRSKLIGKNYHPQNFSS